MLKAGALHLLILFAGPAAPVHHPGEIRLYPRGSLEAKAVAKIIVLGGPVAKVGLICLVDDDFPISQSRGEMGKRERSLH